MIMLSITIQLIKLVKKHWLFVIYLFLGIFVRYANIKTNLFFTWDSGRDAWKLAEIVSGNLTLIGPTSGLPGFFLGPLWYYVGVPGYLLGSGNPFIISYWYIFLGCLALPMFWYLSLLLFPAKKDQYFALLTACLLAFVPGSISGSTFIWNPLISVPLVTVGLIGLIKARESLFWLFVSFLSWALVLQSEFAYGVFFILPLFILMGWIRNRQHIVDYFVSFVAVLITGIPQILFELKNNFLLTKSLWVGLQSQERLVKFSYLFSHRPKELIWVTYELLFRGIDQARVFLLLLIPFYIWTTYQIFKKGDYKWKVVALLGWVPYAFYMFWRGNYGNFFDYYVTPHFILLVPVLVFGIYQFYKSKYFNQSVRLLVVGLIIGWFSMSSINYIFIRINKSQNGAGIVSMQKAMETLFFWQQRDGFANKSAFMFFTPNAQTENHDYIMHFVAKNNGLPVPLTFKTIDTTTWYIIIEENHQNSEITFVPWYKNVAEGGVRVRSIKVGDLVAEAWMTRAEAQEKGFLEVSSALDFMSMPAYPGIATHEEMIEQLER